VAAEQMIETTEIPPGHVDLRKGIDAGPMLIVHVILH
jgi:hypothetical protein